MVPGFDDAKTTEMRARLDDRLGLGAVTYLLFFVKLGPGLALFLVLVFAIWIGWRWLCWKCPVRTALPPDPSPALARAQRSPSPQKSRLRVKTSAA